MKKNSHTESIKDNFLVINLMDDTRNNICGRKTP